MTIKTLASAIIFTAALLPCAQAQSFVNLDFEWADPVITNQSLPLQTVTPGSAFPSWQVKQGMVTLDSAFLEGGFVVLVSPGITNNPTPPPLAYGPVAGPLEGDYSLFLQGRHGDWNGMGGGDDLGEISQTGMVPPGTTTLTFMGWAEGFFAPGPHLTVLVDGQPLALNESPSGQTGVSLFSTDVSQWAGQVVEMEFVARVPPAGFPTDGFWKGGALIDAIQFVPEPSAFTLALIGTIAVGLRRRRPTYVG